MTFSLFEFWYDDFFFQLYILDDVELPVSGAKKPSRELSSILHNLKKVEQALETVDTAFYDGGGEDEKW